MELHWDDGRIMLAKPDEFNAFKVVLTGGEDRFADAVRDLAGTVRFNDRHGCWVTQAGLLTVAGPLATPQWLVRLEGMVAKARPHGWIDEATGDIRAHVEWR